MSLSNTSRIASPLPRLAGVTFDLNRGASMGFIADQWVPENQHVPVQMVRRGTITTRADRQKFRAGFNGNPNGLAYGAERPVVKTDDKSDLTWSATRFGFRTEHVYGEMPQWLRPDAAFATTAAETAARAYASSIEIDDAEHINLAITRQKEMHFARKIWGSDNAGAGAAYPNSTLSALVGLPGEGMLWSDPKFPLVEWLAEVLDQHQDRTGKTSFSILAGIRAARHWSRNLQMLGVRLIEGGGNAAAGYGLEALTMNSRITQSALIGRLVGEGNAQDTLGRIDRVVIGAARADFGPANGAEDLRWLHPDAIHIAAFGERAPVASSATNNQADIRVGSTAMIRVQCDRVPFKPWNERDNLYGFYADDYVDYRPVHTDHGITYFNA